MSNSQALLDAVDSSVQSEIDNALEMLQRNLSPAAQRRILENLVHECRQQERHSVLGCLMTTEKVAAIYGVTKRRIQAKVKLMEERGISVGMKVGRDYIFHPEELPILAPAKIGRPRKE